MNKPRPKQAEPIDARLDEALQALAALLADAYRRSHTDRKDEGELEGRKCGKRKPPSDRGLR